MIIVAAPSGSGKTTIVKHLLQKFEDQLAFSVSVTTRAARAYEKDGKDYYFVDVEEFKRMKQRKAFVEWEEVYPSAFYGTLYSELGRLWELGKCIIFDIDVKGAINLKKKFFSQSLAIFVRPPSLSTLADRLQKRGTEDELSLKKRVEKARQEMEYESRFDVTLVNDNLEDCLKEAENLVDVFLSK